MPSRELYNAKLILHGHTHRDRIINMTKDDIAQGIVHSPSYKKVFINEEIEQYLEIVSTQTDNKKRFTTMPNETINLGDLITWSGMHWLVTKVDFDDEIVRRGEIEQCNRQIKWQNSESLKIVSRWCLCTKPYTSNIDENNITSISNREYKIQLPYDAETCLIDLDKRFMLEKINGKPRTYAVTSVDSLTNRYEDMGNNSGFLVWNLTQDQSVRENDNEELWICDYVSPGLDDSPTPPVNPDPTLLKCEISGRDSIKIGGATRKYTAKFYKVDEDTEVTDESIIPQWELVCPSGYEKCFLLEQNDNFMNIKVLDNSDLVGQHITLKLADTAGLYQPVEFKIKLVVT